MRSIVAILLLACAFKAMASDCKQPLDADILDRLRLGATDVELRPGEVHRFMLLIPSTYKPAEEVRACATWRVEPEGKGAEIEAQGILKIDSSTPAGSRFVVTADIEHGRATRQIAVLVYTSKTHPLVGVWQQRSQFDCDGKSRSASTEFIRELEFRANGWFSVTWDPFETYRDYWGTYVVNPVKGTISFHIDQGNYVPGDFRGEGRYRIKVDGALELTGIYLGDKPPGAYLTSPANRKFCRYLFARMP